MEKDYLKQGDCLELMARLPRESIDMILADLPYAETGNKWDKLIDLPRFFKECERVIKEDGAIVLFGSFKFGMKLYESAPHLYKYEWVWQKSNGTNFPASGYQPLRKHEFVFVFGKGRVSNGTKTAMKYNPVLETGKPYAQTTGRESTNFHGGIRRCKTVNEGTRLPSTILRFPRDGHTIHPTQKPLKLCEYLINTYTDKGDIVLDTCMGSGTTCVAAINTERHYIGFEKNADYFKSAKNRIDNTVCQISMDL